MKKFLKEFLVVTFLVAFGVLLLWILTPTEASGQVGPRRGTAYYGTNVEYAAISNDLYGAIMSTTNEFLKKSGDFSTNLTMTATSWVDTVYATNAIRFVDDNLSLSNTANGVAFVFDEPGNFMYRMLDIDDNDHKLNLTASEINFVTFNVASFYPGDQPEMQANMQWYSSNQYTLLRYRDMTNWALWSGLQWGDPILTNISGTGAITNASWTNDFQLGNAVLSNLTVTLAITNAEWTNGFQPGSAWLSNGVTTGFNTNNYVPGANITLTTNAGVITVASTGGGGTAITTVSNYPTGTNFFIDISQTNRPTWNLGSLATNCTIVFTNYPTVTNQAYKFTIRYQATDNLLAMNWVSHDSVYKTWLTVFAAATGVSNKVTRIAGEVMVTAAATNLDLSAIEQP